MQRFLYIKNAKSPFLPPTEARDITTASWTLAMFGVYINYPWTRLRPFFRPFSGEGATVIGRPGSGFIRHPHQPRWAELHSDNMPPKFDPNEIKIGMSWSWRG